MNIQIRSVFIAAVLAIAGVPGALGQGPEFEVASVRRTGGDGPTDFSPRRSGGRIVMHNVRLASIVIYAFHLEHGRATTSYQLVGSLRLPEGWEVYDIDAIAEGSPSDDDVRVLFQSLLQDRFQLKTHWETRQLPTYELVVAKKGAKLKPSSPGRDVAAENDRVDPEPGVSHLMGRGQSVEQLVASIGARLELPIRNLSGLGGGAFDYDVSFAVDGNLSRGTSAPDLVTAVEKELGLKLRRTVGSVQVLVVDHVVKPSEN